MKYVVIRDMSAGNESVGEMWQETKIFDSTATLEDVMKWAMPDCFREKFPLNHSTKKIQITIPHKESEA